jgi:hypothetical protein
VHFLKIGIKGYYKKFKPEDSIEKIKYERNPNCSLGTDIPEQKADYAF